MQAEYRAPRSQEEYEEVYNLCYRVLMEPWGEPSGIEREPNSAVETYMVVVADEAIVATCRLDRLSPTLGQVRFVAVDSSVQGKGYGRRLMVEIESEAKRRGFTEIMLHARDNAFMFYHRLGYDLVASSFVWHGIQHYEMRKSLTSLSNLQDKELYHALQTTFASKGPETTMALFQFFLQDVVKKNYIPSLLAPKTDQEE